MEIEVKAAKRIEDGRHEGTITAVEYRTTPFEYTDIVVTLKDGQKVKTGVPTTITPESKLGKILIDFGVSLKVGSKIDPEENLLNKKCSLMTMTRVTERGSFANVVQGSLKPR